MLERKYKKPHPALEGYSEPHPSMLWLVDAFFTLHRRRRYPESGPEAISYAEMAEYADYVLDLPKNLHPLYFRVLGEVDDTVRTYLFEKSRAKLEEMKNSPKSRKGGRSKG